MNVMPMIILYEGKAKDCRAEAIKYEAVVRSIRAACEHKWGEDGTHGHNGANEECEHCGATR